MFTPCLVRPFTEAVGLGYQTSGGKDLHITSLSRNCINAAVSFQILLLVLSCVTNAWEIVQSVFSKY